MAASDVRFGGCSILSAAPLNSSPTFSGAREHHANVKPPLASFVVRWLHRKTAKWHHANVTPPTLLSRALINRSVPEIPSISWSSSRAPARVSSTSL